MLEHTVFPKMRATIGGARWRATIGGARWRTAIWQQVATLTHMASSIAQHPENHNNPRITVLKDGATLHTANITVNFLDGYFGCRLLSTT